MTVETLRVRSTRRAEMLDVTAQLQEVLARRGLREGALVAQSLHTTAALTLNENADPDVPRDLLAKLEQLIPHREPFYRHDEGNSDSHLKTAFFGPSLTLLVSGGKLVLGRWQGVFLCDFDGPRERTIAVQLLPAAG
ncbi:MAG TPA: secondary thiamine-phosphate synthase enzyme YjbQ [Longimicrobiaceae bacterium]|nr:secondary thiamine-phosphate synthase enzyme YjbQ [Longimicrobiaceae bacterium]